MSIVIQPEYDQPVQIGHHSKTATEWIALASYAEEAKALLTEAYQAVANEHLSALGTRMAKPDSLKARINAFLERGASERHETCTKPNEKREGRWDYDDQDRTFYHTDFSTDAMLKLDGDWASVDQRITFAARVLKALAGEFCHQSNSEPKRTFSDFIRNATPTEKQEVYEKVIDRSIERQRHQVGRESSGADAIAAERVRQMEVEKWNTDHDDDHEDASLTHAALCYARLATFQIEDKPYAPILRAGAPIDWPWTPDSYKPKDARRNLVRAGALIAAEIDRIDRAEKLRTVACRHVFAPHAMSESGEPVTGRTCVLCDAREDSQSAIGTKS